MCIFPMIYTVFHNRNTVSYNQVLLLQANNVISNTTEDCSYLQDAVQSWLKSVVVLPSSSRFIQKDNRRVFAPWAQLLPVRCNWQQQDGVITYCGSDLGLCNYYGESVTADSAANLEDFADSLGLRKGELAVISSQMIAPADFHDGSITADFFVQAIFDQSHIVTLA